MNMQFLDWLIVVLLLSVVAWFAWYTKRFTRSVADFLAANRCANRYLLVCSMNASAMGATYFVTNFEMNYETGFAGQAWWGTMIMVLAVIVAIVGWVSYRYRQTRALTMAQFFEIRYSRRFRIFAGILIFVSGILNFGLFPAIACRFFIYFCGLPETLQFAGFSMPTLAPTMFVLLGIAMAFTFSGGQIAVMVTDFIQGLFENIMFTVFVIFLLIKFPWNFISEALVMAPAGKSMIDPFQSSGHENFSPMFFFIQCAMFVYTYMAWQGNQGYYCAAKSPHEARMAVVLNQLRGFGQGAMLLFLPICAYTILHHPHYATEAGLVNGTLSQIANETIRKQMTVPAAAAVMLPMGLFGCFAAMMLASFISNHDTLLHSWGSTFIQDVFLPLYRKPLSQRQHMWLLRLSIIGVAIFVFTWSLLLRQTQNAIMYFQITGAIYIGGAGACIVGGLYWRRGTTAGAWSGLIVGSILGLAGLLIKQACPDLLPKLITSQVIAFITMIVAAGVYLIVSLLTCREPFNLDRMLHRGQYADPGDAASANPVRGIRALWSGKDVTGWDQFIFALAYGKIAVFLGIFIVGTVLALTIGISTKTWLAYWHGYTFAIAAIAAVVVLWLSIGGVRDLISLLRILKMARRDSHDDGRVRDSLGGEEQLPPASRIPPQAIGAGRS